MTFQLARRAAQRIIWLRTLAENTTSDHPGTDRLSFRVALPLVLIVFLDAFSLTIILPLLPYYATAFGIGLIGIGVLVALSPVLEILSAPLHRVLSKRLGRRPVLVISSLGIFVGFLLLGAATTTGMLYLSRLIDGISSGNNTVGRRIIRDILTPETRAHGMGLIEATYGVGFLAGPLTGFLILQLSGDNYRLIPYFAAGLSLVFAIIVFIFAPETLPPEKRKSSGLSLVDKVRAKFSPIKQPVVLFLFIILFIELFSFLGFLEFSGILALERLGLGALEVMLGFFIASLLLIIVQIGLVGPLSRRFGERSVILLGIALLGVGLIVAALTPSRPVPWYSIAHIESELALEASFLGEPQLLQEIPLELPPEAVKGFAGLLWFGVGVLFIVVGSGLLTPAINSLLMYNVPTIASGTVLGISSGFYKGIQIIAPLILGFAFVAFGLAIPFFAAGIILLILFLVAIFYLAPKPPASYEPNPEISGGEYDEF